MSATWQERDVRPVKARRRIPKPAVRGVLEGMKPADAELLRSFGHAMGLPIGSFLSVRLAWLARQIREGDFTFYPRHYTNDPEEITKFARQHGYDKITLRGPGDIVETLSLTGEELPASVPQDENKPAAKEGPGKRIFAYLNEKELMGLAAIGLRVAKCERREMDVHGHCLTIKDSKTGETHWRIETVLP